VIPCQYRHKWYIVKNYIDSPTFLPQKSVSSPTITQSAQKATKFGEIAENFNSLSRVHECYRRQTDDRWTDDDIWRTWTVCFELPNDHWPSSLWAAMLSSQDSYISKMNYTVCQKKRHPFYFCDNLVRCHSTLPILGRNIPQEILNKTCT